MDAAAYEAEILAWRRDHERALTREDGWLTQIGIEWLGDTPLVLEVGSFERAANGVHFRAVRNEDVRLAGERIGEALLMDPVADSSEVLTLGKKSWQLVRRGDALGVRARDAEAPARRSFRGLAWYPVRAAWRIEARFVPEEGSRAHVMRYTAGQEEDAVVPGHVAFAADGREHRLIPYARRDASWLFVFRDETNGRDTYELCRYFYAQPAGADGRVVLDFNRAAAPVCAYVPFVTCVLPPPENALALRVEAGELRYDPR